MRRTLHNLLLITLLLGWAHTVYQRSASQSSLTNAPSGYFLSERLSLAAKYCDPLAPPIRSLLLRLALMNENDPERRAVILGQPIPLKAQETLSPGFRLMAQYQVSPNPMLEQQLRILASNSLIRLNHVLLAQASIFLIALAYILLGSHQTQKAEPPETPGLGFNASTVIGLYAAWDTLSYFLTRQLSRVPGLVTSEFGALYLRAGLSYLLLTILLAVAARRGRWKPSWRGGWGWVGPAYLLCFVGIHLIEIAMLELFGIAMPENTFLLRLLSQASPLQSLSLVVMLAMVGPFFEEFAFRGWLLGGLVTHWGARESLLFSALVFAASHGISAYFPALLLLGWVLGWVYLRSGSLWACVAVHTLWNASSLATMFAQAPL